MTLVGMSGKRNHCLAWTGLVLVLLALVLVPFAIYGQQIEAWTDSFLDSAAEHRLVSALVLGGLLASDILLPIPSSIVSAGAGRVLGITWGTLTSTIGMIISCALGYSLGAVCGRPVVLRMVGQTDLDRFEALSKKMGLWALLLSRPIPVLAEVSVLFAGISRLSFWRFFLLTSLSNLGISLVYAILGAQSLLLAFAAAIGLPAIGMWIMRKRPVCKENEPSR